MCWLLTSQQPRQVEAPPSSISPAVPPSAIGREKHGVFTVLPRKEAHPPHLYFIVRTKHIILKLLLEAILMLPLTTPHGWGSLSQWWPHSKSKRPERQKEIEREREREKEGEMTVL